MPEDPAPRIYVDSNVYLAYINGEADKLLEIDPLLAEAERREVELWTSVVTIVEVAFGKLEQDGKVPSAEVMAKIEALWVQPSPSKVVEFYDLIAEDARELIRRAIPTGRKPLKPMDAIHIATAQRWGISLVYTYDQNMIGWGSTLGMTIENPHPLKPVLWSTVSPPDASAPVPPA